VASYLICLDLKSIANTKKQIDNDWRSFRTLQLSAELQSTLDYIVQCVVYEPLNPEEVNVLGYSTLRKCRRDATHVAEIAADIGVCSPSGGEEEKKRRELHK